MTSDAKIAAWFGHDIDTIRILYSMFGGIGPEALQDIISAHFVRRKHSKVIEFGVGLSTIAISKYDSIKQHVLVSADQVASDAISAFCLRKPELRLTSIQGGWYDWEPELDELYNLVYLHNSPDFDIDAIVEKLPECVAPYGKVIIDNIPDEPTFSAFETLGAKLGLSVVPVASRSTLAAILQNKKLVIGEGPGTELLKIFDLLGIPKCQMCVVLAHDMNMWGVDETLANMDVIIADILPRARRWWRKSKRWMKADMWFRSDRTFLERLKDVKDVATGNIDDILRDSIRNLVFEAIRNIDTNPEVDYAIPHEIITVPPAEIVTGHLAMADTYKDAHVFLVCGGPSLNNQDLSLLQKLTVAAVNQVGATHIRPDIWFSVDAPGRFHPKIWEDPAIVKFTTNKHRQDEYREFVNGQWAQQSRAVDDLPNTHFFNCVDECSGSEFFSTTVSWSAAGGHKSVMMAALRILYWLGFRNVYLLGCDFAMSPDKGYAFDQPTDAIRRWENNRSFDDLNKTFGMLRPVFEKHSFKVYNCTPGGDLTTLPRLTLEAAIERAI